MRLRNNDTGIALILVLWVLVLLIALATEFALSMKTEVNTTRNFKEDIEVYYIAKAGINLAMAEILSDVQFHSWTEEKGYIFGPVVATGDQDEGGQAFQQASQEEALEVPEPPQRVDLPLEKGLIHYSIRDENGKININTASRETLTKALEVNGLSLGLERDTIVDSILDWIDQDNLLHVNGAESDYYQGLSPAYYAKNGPLDSVEELLRIKGVTPELFYGSEEYLFEEPSSSENTSGLRRIFTVQKVTQFNPNTAERVVLEIMYPDNQVEEILAKKEERGWYNESKSTHFKIEATGTFADSPTQHTIVAIIEKQGQGNEATLLTRYWNGNLIWR